MPSPSVPLLLITLGDVVGVGPEIVARAWPQLLPLCRPVVCGDETWLRRGLALIGSSAQVHLVTHPADRPASADGIPCIQGTSVDLQTVPVGQMTGKAGQAAYDFLCRAIDLTRAGEADGIVTCPLNKEGLHAAGLHYPGHTEILAERCGVPHHAMLLYADGLGVAHVTLHMALRDVFEHLTTEAVLETTRLLNEMLTRILERKPRLGVAALNPHASDGGLFGDEEVSIIRPAVEQAQGEGIDATGPWPADTLFGRAHAGQFDGVVAMYHDQGHIALKLRSGWRAVNITAGLPLVRTSVAHGTAYDIAGRGSADCSSLVEATRLAVQLTRHPVLAGQESSTASRKS
jgi:4-hydroxythreonine-4-phosphate dehydrogenase